MTRRPRWPESVGVRDGTVLRANLFRPPGPGPFPTLLSIHPYGKDALPVRRRRGSGYRVPSQMRMLPQSEAFTISALTSWEAPDPAVWTRHGYAVVNADLRGWGTSDGVGELLSAQEGRDGHDVVEWIAAQPWSTGRVGMLGVSYLAITQWAVAAERPPHLAAICPWEGFTDAYHDVARRGGVLEDGFLRLWSVSLRRQRRSPVTIRREARRRLLFDEWWRDRVRDIERIEVPVLACASFSDHNLHSAGTFAGYERVGSTDKELFTHRGPKWATFYSPDAVAAQLGFFDRTLRDSSPDGPARTLGGTSATRDPHATQSTNVPTGSRTLGGTSATGDPHATQSPAAGPAALPVRLEVRSDATTVTSVRHVAAWPPPWASELTLHLRADGRLAEEPANESAVVEFDHLGERASFAWRIERDVELIGPMRLGLQVEVLRLDIQARWFFPTNPLVGQFPARYERSEPGRCRLRLGAGSGATLTIRAGKPRPGCSERVRSSPP